MSTETKRILSKEVPTKEQVAAWKKEFDSQVIHVIAVKDDGDKGAIKRAYLREPSIEDLSRASASEKAKPGTYLKSLFENCVIQLHPDIDAKKKLYNGAVRLTGDIEMAAEGTLEKL